MSDNDMRHPNNLDLEAAAPDWETGGSVPEQQVEGRSLTEVWATGHAAMRRLGVIDGQERIVIAYPDEAFICYTDGYVIRMDDGRHTRGFIDWQPTEVIPYGPRL
jgi:hypothetical protein